MNTGDNAPKPDPEAAVAAVEGSEGDLMVVQVGLGYESDTATEPSAMGEVVIQLLPEVAPGHVERIKTLTQEGFYNNIVFHRVIDGFMAQTGDPGGDGTGGSSKPNLQAEFNDTPFDRGVVGMARAASPNSANSQFFIMFARSPNLDGQYTAFGRVIEGMDVVDRIKRGPADRNGVVDGARDRMVRVEIRSKS